MRVTEKMAGDYDKREERLSKRIGRPPFWTPDKDDIIEQFVPRIGATRTANMLNVLPKAVWDRSRVLGVKATACPKFTLDDCDEMLAEFCNKTMRQIAEERGLSQQTVKRCIRRARGVKR